MIGGVESCWRMPPSGHPTYVRACVDVARARPGGVLCAGKEDWLGLVGKSNAHLKVFLGILKRWGKLKSGLRWCPSHLEGRNVMAEERQRFLCFEYLPQGSLDNYICDASQGLEWMTRFQIIKGICEGLHYLHQQKFVHLDLKPANILLDRYKVPKIADFGLSKCFDEKQTRAMTSKVIGSQGYMAPEYYGGTITFKSDIYSLGIVIIEILTGQKGYPEIENVLQSWTARFGTSQGDIQLEPVRICAKIGIECIDSDPAKRPVTQRIIERLAKVDSDPRE